MQRASSEDTYFELGLDWSENPWRLPKADLSSSSKSLWPPFEDVIPSGRAGVAAQGRLSRDRCSFPGCGGRENLRAVYDGQRR